MTEEQSPNHGLVLTVASAGPFGVVGRKAAAAQTFGKRMMMKEDPEGREFNWFGVDDTGAIGMFATAGGGFIPESVLAHLEEHDAIADSIPTPHIGTKKIWDDYASVGLWVFDWGYMGAPGPYDIVHAPTVPMGQELVARILAIPDLLRFATPFAKTTSFTVEMIKTAHRDREPHR